MADTLEEMMEETLTLCRTPPVPRKHPYREFYQYRKSLPPTPAKKPEMEMVGPPMYHFGSQSELVPKPLFSRSKTLPSHSSHPFHDPSDIVKSPSPLFSRRNTLPPRLSRHATAKKGPSPLSNAQTPGPTSAPVEPTSPVAVSPKDYHYDNNASKRKSFPARVARVADAEKSPSPLFSRGHRKPLGPTRFKPLDPGSPIVLSPVVSNTNSVVSSPVPSLCLSDVDSSSSSTPSTPATSPSSSPNLPSRSLTCYFPPSCWTVVPSPSPVYVPRHSLRHKQSPRRDTLRGIRAKESDACLQQIYDQQTSAYLDGSIFSDTFSTSFEPVVETPDEGT